MERENKYLEALNTLINFIGLPLKDQDELLGKEIALLEKLCKEKDNEPNART